MNEHGGRVSYRSSPAQLTRVMCWAGVALMLGLAGLLISDSISGRKTSGSPIGFAIACLMIAVLCGRVSLAVLTVSDDSIRIVNWFRTYDIPRASGLQFYFGDDVSNAPFFSRDNTHVVLRANSELSVNVAALTLGPTRLGVDGVSQIVDDLNARMRIWDRAAVARAETN